MDLCLSEEEGAYPACSSHRWRSDTRKSIHSDTFRLLLPQSTANAPVEYLAWIDNAASPNVPLLRGMGLPVATNEERSTAQHTDPVMASNGRNDVNSHYPSSADASNSITQHGFRITTRKLPILKAEPIEQMTAALGIAPPEMIFGDNMITIDHEASGFWISFNTYDALDRVDKTGNTMLQVAHSREWQSTRYA